MSSWSRWASWDTNGDIARACGRRVGRAERRGKKKNGDRNEIAAGEQKRLREARLEYRFGLLQIRLKGGNCNMVARSQVEY